MAAQRNVDRDAPLPESDRCVVMRKGVPEVTPEGVFQPLPTMSLASIEELFRHRVLRMLRPKGLLIPERIKLTECWAHSGFNVNAQVRIGADDAACRENLARYLIPRPSR